MRKMVVDTHTHTVASGHAYSTLIENCLEASKKGMKLIAMTDHGPAMPGGAHEFHFGNLKVIPESIHGVEVLRGVEANIIDFDGNLDLPDERIIKLDIVIASLHDVCIKPGSKRDNTKALIGAMRKGFVDIIAHPGNPSFEIDAEEVLKAAKEYNVLVEINNSSFTGSRAGSYENCRRIAEICAKENVFITIGSDAHICYSIGEFQKAEELIKEAGIMDEYIINTDPDKIKNYLRSKGKLKTRNL
ncbi:phosphatase [Fonticella tunisiensis]|uniref:Putative hydrolase n=1 Tax=Fonticella tunisiensis TaxID=1096341 RepID=A0A4R7KXN3_9CLOT|nr:phosphatase [Fonticella tunisiensis]TDT63726.1 putative hydrolase [Fonticella tunisiensis]